MDINKYIIEGVNLVAVSKKHSVDKIKEAVNSGVKIIAENRIQEAEEKYAELKDFFKEKNVEFHFIGNLQRNKAKKAVMMFDLIQCIDSYSIAAEIDKRAKTIDKVQRVLVQVNIGKEKKKKGLKPKDVLDIVSKLSTLENIKLEGLMCITPNIEPEDRRIYFKRMKQLYDKSNNICQMKYLSMGMTIDYKIAIEEGSNMIRLGTAIFGERT